MATATRAIRAVTPHVPKIRFPQRTTKADISFKNATPVVSSDAINPPSSSSSKPNIGSTARGSGVDILPQRYHRLPISQEEMEYIEKGGPV